MGQVLIRNLDEQVIAAYREAAERDSRSLEAELRDVSSRMRLRTFAEVQEARTRLAEVWAMTPDVPRTPAEVLVREDHYGYRDAYPHMSVVGKWIVAEEQSEAALELVGSDLVAPDLLKAELADALWKKVRRGQTEPLQAASGFAYAVNLLTFAPAAHLANCALDLSHPVYECLFLA